MNFSKYFKRFAALCTGFFLISIGVMLTVNAHLGVAPWDCLYLGLSKTTGISFGRISQLFGITLLSIGLFFKVLPGLGTLCDVIMVGAFLDFIAKINLIHPAEGMIVQFFYLLGGVILIGCGISLYMSAAFGTGPRDGLMIILMRKFDSPVWKIRMMIDVLALILGFIFGGPIGIGTPVIAFGVGPTLQFINKIVGIDIKNIEHRTIDKDIEILKGYINRMRIKKR